MNSSRVKPNVKRRVTRSSGESDLDESHVAEERLKNLLTNARDQERPRNIFNNIQEVPKLRRSVVARAVQNVICSTPMPTEKKRNFFYAENSLNISPIDPICEKVEHNLDKKEQGQEQNKLENKEFQNKYDCNKYVKVILTRTSLPIVISDSDDDREVQEFLGEEQSKNLSKNTRTHYSTRSESKKNTAKQIENIQNRENISKYSIPDPKHKPVHDLEQVNSDFGRDGTLRDKSNSKIRDKSKSKRLNSRDTVSNQKNCQSVQQKKSPISTHSKLTEVTEFLNSKSQDATDKCTSIKSVQYKSPKSKNNLESQGNVDIDVLATTSLEKENATLQTTLNNINVVTNQNISTRGVKSQLLRNSVTNYNRNKEEENTCLSLRNNFNRTQQESREGEKNTKEVHFPNDTVFPKKIILGKNLTIIKYAGNDSNVHYRKKVSPRKLSYSSTDENEYNENATIREDGGGFETKKRHKQVSNITITTSRSKSREEKVESQLKNSSKDNVITSLVFNEYNECGNGSDNCKGDSFQVIKPPPKRPPRKKKPKKKTLSTTAKFSKANEATSVNSQGKLKENKEKGGLTELLKQLDSSGAKVINSIESIEVPSAEGNVVDIENSISKIQHKFIEDNVSKRIEHESSFRHVTGKEILLVSQNENIFGEGKNKQNGDDDRVVRDNHNNEEFEKEKNEHTKHDVEINRSIVPENYPGTNQQNKTKETNGTVVCETQKNPRKTLVEIGTSPLIVVTPNENEKKNMVEAGTSTCHFTSERDIFSVTDPAKAEILSQLILKISQRHSNLSDLEIQENNCHLSKQNQIQTESQLNHFNEQLDLKKRHREVQTSVKKNNVPQSKVEQQTQTTNSARKGMNIFKKVSILSSKAITFEKSDSSKSSLLTDHSDVITEFEKTTGHMLYESLRPDDLNFSSSTDEAFEGTLLNKSQEDRPWRLDADLQILPRRSSCKLNFLRSAHEIEMNSNLESGNNKDSNSSMASRTSRVGSTNRNKLQMYTRKTQCNTDKVSQSLKLQSMIAIRKGSCSSNSSMSDLVITESDKECQLSKQNKESALVTKNIVNSTEEEQNVESLNETNKDTTLKATSVRNRETETNIINDLEGNNNSNLQIRTSNLSTEVTPNKKILNDSKKKYKNKKDKSSDKNANKHVVITKSTCTKSRDHSTGNISHTEDDDEILAVPLEDSDSPPIVSPCLFKATRSPKKTGTNNENDMTKNDVGHRSSTNNVVDNVIKSPLSTLSSTKQGTDSTLRKNYSQIKPVKARILNSKTKKVIPEHDDCVSSTTVDAEEATGLRRSGRERKVTQRRNYGTIATSSERVLQYYNGLSVGCNSTVNKSTKSRTKKKDAAKKSTNDKNSEEPKVKKSKRGRNQDRNNIKSPNLVEETAEGAENILNESIKQVENPHSSHVEENVSVINRVNDRTVDHTDDVITSGTRKHLPHTDCDSSTHNISQNVIPNKRNRVLNNTESQMNNPSENGVTPINEINENHLHSLVSNKSPSQPENVIFNTNVYYSNVSLGITNNINKLGTANGVEDNYFSSQSFSEPNGDFEYQSSMPQNNINGELSRADKAVEKDSGRSTMLRSTSSDESNVRISKPLTGRIRKSYKKKANVCTKISKVLSRSINISKECEIFNDNETNMLNSIPVTNVTENNKLRRSSLIQSKPMESDHIDILSNDNLVNMKYVDKVPTFKLVNDDNLMVTDGIKNVKDGGAMGYLKLPPLCQKPLHIARKFALFYFVIEGEGFVQVQNKTSKVGKLSCFIVPLGSEYSIRNINKQDALIVGFVKMPSNGVS